MNRFRRGLFVRRGFTLLELLVVIAVIAILAGLMLPAYQAVRRRFRAMRAKTEVLNLKTAWSEYLAEYGKWPDFASQSAPVPMKEEGTPALRVLQGREEQPKYNHRKRVFMEFSLLNAKTGDPINPWADPDADATAAEDLYYAKFDVDYDNVIPADGRTPEDDVKASVIVWTVDRDGNVIGSWQN
ncbi:MAG: prepilin-type N-terminal cleavage/methylation domain-containing protein [Kiritimatiellae bacterium]|nr:prepilin-type N-terminal cleavage/methylation domain-containing protein [Kiritimatiellia bacterium]